MLTMAPSSDGARRRTVFRIAVVIAALTLVATLSAATRDARAQEPGALVGSGSATSVLPASKFVPIVPTRVLDTRPQFGPTRGMARLADNNALSVDPINGPPPANGGANVASQLGNLGIDPADATAVVVNITYVNAGGPGFTSVWPTGFAQPTASTNNADVAGQTKPNLVITPLGLDGKISVYSFVEADYLVDVMGVMVEAGDSSDGRFFSLGPVRHSDTRFPGRHVVDQARYTAGEIRSVDLTPAGVPATASAVVLNVTSARSDAPGFIRVWPDGDPQPDHSNVNMAVAGEATSNQVITGVNNGSIEVFTLSATDLIIDVTGYFGPTDTDGADGLFVPITPGRLLDTRDTSGPNAFTGGERVAGDDSLRLPVTGRLDVPDSGVKAAAFNVTAVRPEDAGFVTVFPSSATLPATSSVNYNGAGVVVPNHAITSLSSTGQIDLYTLAPSHLVVDVSGYFLDENGIPPVGTRPTKTIRQSSFVPTPLDGNTRPTSAPYDFLFDRGEYFANGLQRSAPTRKVAWNTCQGPLRYAINVDFANDEQIEALITSIEQVEMGTGIDFQLAAVTSAGLDISDRVLLGDSFGLPFQYLPPADDGSGPVDLVVGFSNDDRTPDLAGGVIGVGGSVRTEYDSTGRAESQRGFALADVRDLGNGSGIEIQNITSTLTHELGHMVGLGHVDGGPPDGRQGLEAPGSWTAADLRAQLMFPTLNVLATGTDFSSGDRLGLWELYNTNEQNCDGLLQFATDTRRLVEVGKILDTPHEHDGDHHDDHDGGHHGDDEHGHD